MKTIHKALLGVFVILVLGVIAIKTANAASSCYPASGPCLTLAQGAHSVINGSGSSWTATVGSWTANPTISLDDIGYGWWNIKHGCNGVWTWGWTSSVGEVAHYKTSFTASRTNSKPSCSSSAARTGYSGGSHDFYKYPYSHLYYNTSDTRSIP